MNDQERAFAAQTEIIERIIGHCYFNSCHHGEGHAMADPTLHCCDFSEIVWAYEALKDGRYDDVERIFAGTIDWEPLVATKGA